LTSQGIEEHPVGGVGRTPIGGHDFLMGRMRERRESALCDNEV